MCFTSSVGVLFCACVSCESSRKKVCSGRLVWLPAQRRFGIGREPTESLPSGILVPEGLDDPWSCFIRLGNALVSNVGVCIIGPEHGELLGSIGDFLVYPRVLRVLSCSGMYHWYVALEICWVVREVCGTHESTIGTQPWCM